MIQNHQYELEVEIILGGTEDGDGDKKKCHVPDIIPSNPLPYNWIDNHIDLPSMTVSSVLPNPLSPREVGQTSSSTSQVSRLY